MLPTARRSQLLQSVRRRSLEPEPNNQRSMLLCGAPRELLEHGWKRSIIAFAPSAPSRACAIAFRDGLGHLSALRASFLGELLPHRVGKDEHVEHGGCREQPLPRENAQQRMHRRACDELLQPRLVGAYDRVDLGTVAEEQDWRDPGVITGVTRSGLARASEQRSGARMGSGSARAHWSA